MKMRLENAFRFFSGSSLRRDVVTTSFLTVIGRGFGFLIPFFIAAFFGTTEETDTFFLAFGLVLFIELVAGYIFETVIVPYVTQERSQKSDIGEWMGTILIRSTVILAGVLLVLLLVAKPFMSLTTQFSARNIHLGFVLTLEMVPMVLFMAWTSALNGALNAYKTFHIPVLSTGIRSLIVIILMIFFKERLGVHAIALGYSLGELARLFFSYFFFRKEIGPLKLGRVPIPTAGHFFRSASFQTAGFSLLCLLPILNQVMASWVGTGGLSLYVYAERLRNVPSLLFSTGVVSVVLSHWANQYSFDAKNFSWKKNSRIIGMLAGAAAGLFLLSFLFRDALAALAFKRGEFPTERLGTVADLFALMMLGFPFDVTILLCVRLLIIFKKDSLYMKLAFGKLVVNAILNVLLMVRFGIYGIALSTAAVNALFAWILYQRVKQMGAKA